ncbi:MAG: hypothetical protein GWP14_08735 [Actinobacteria bacterium]|nr:hypothetical protein [Actinomycetota bacterium]
MTVQSATNWTIGKSSISTGMGRRTGGNPIIIVGDQSDSTNGDSDDGSGSGSGKGSGGDNK